MKIKNYLFLGIACLLAVTACKKHSTPKPGTLDTKIDTDVYIVGSVFNYQTYKSMATYWKNGKLHTVSDGTTDCYGVGMVVHGNDVYVCGYDYDLNTAVYWKNENKIKIPLAVVSGQTFAKANAIKLSDNGAIVYIVGYIYDGSSTRPVYWHSDDPTPMAHILSVKKKPLTSYRSIATTLALNGADVYIGGFNADSAVYWKNGDYINVWDSGLDVIKAIAFKGTELNMAGYTTASLVDAAVSWQGAAITRTSLQMDNNHLSPSRALAIAATNTDVYMGGYTTTAAGLSVASYWKNGQLQPSVDLGPDLGGDSEIFGIAVTGNTVYACGNYGGGYGAYWKSGTITPLGELSEVADIVVVTHPQVN